MFSLHIQRYSNQLLAYSYLPRSKQHVIVSIKYVPENFIIEIQQWRSNLVFLPGELLCRFLRLTRQDVVERLRVERLEVDLLVVVPVLVALHLDRARCKQPTLCRMMTSRATSLPHVRWIFTHRCTFLLACTVDIYALKAVARCTSLVKALDILKQCDVTHRHTYVQRRRPCPAPRWRRAQRRAVRGTSSPDAPTSPCSSTRPCRRHAACSGSRRRCSCPSTSRTSGTGPGVGACMTTSMCT